MRSSSSRTFFSRLSRSKIAPELGKTAAHGGRVERREIDIGRLVLHTGEEYTVGAPRCQRYFGAERGAAHPGPFILLSLDNFVRVVTPFRLHAGEKKRYSCCVPICPKCFASIHVGALDQCPACGYSLRRADRLFGRGRVEFPRVLDAAGALTCDQRKNMLDFLERIERNISPVALGIYITDNGRQQDFSSLAHWILNHARIHQPSFGKREKIHPVENSEIRMRMPGEAAAREPSYIRQMLRGIGSLFADRFSPLPPSVRQEWMLVLVLDVQLEVACFSWGYMLDPYVDPDRINTCIIKGQLSFREREFVVGLKTVMRAAVKQIASRSRGITRKLQCKYGAWPLLAGAGLACCLAAEPAAAAPLPAPRTPSSASAADEDVAVDPETEDIAVDPDSEDIAVDPDSEDIAVDPDEGENTPVSDASASPGEHAATVDPPVAPPPAATDSDDLPPAWREDDYQSLMSGELAGGYTTLIPARRVSREAPARRRNGDESDHRVPEHYMSAYNRPPEHGLIDPQHLFSTVEQADLLYVLAQVNTHANYRINVVVYKSGQNLGPGLSVANLLRTTSKPCEYTLLISYPLGAPAELELGLQELRVSDEERHRWLLAMRDAASNCGGGVDGLIAAIRSLQQSVAPMAADLKPLRDELNEKMPMIDLPMKDEAADEQVSTGKKFTAFFTDEQNRPLLITLGCLAAAIVVSLAICCRRRRRGVLIDSDPDRRLASPYGAGVSRIVRYLHGRETPPEAPPY